MIGQASVGAANAVADLSALQDSFLTFAHKVAAIVEGLPKAEKANQTKTFGALQARFKDQLRFSTKPLNKTMLNAALAVGSALPAESRAQRVLRLLQLWPPLQGRDFDGELPAEQQGGDGDRGALCEIALTFSFGVVVCGPRDAI